MTKKKRQRQKRPPFWFCFSFKPGDGRGFLGVPVAEKRWVFQARNTKHALKQIENSQELEEILKENGGKITAPSLARGVMKPIGEGKFRFAPKLIEPVVIEVKNEEPAEE